MSIEFGCGCGVVLEADAADAGSAATCPACGGSVRVPGLLPVQRRQMQWLMGGAVAILSAVIFGALVARNELSALPSQDMETTDVSVTVPMQAAGNVSPIPAYWIMERNRMDFSAARRLQVRLCIPEGYSKTQVAEVISDVVAKEGPRMHAISIVVYEDGDNIQDAYTVAMATYAPRGDWAKALDGVQDYAHRTFNTVTEFRDFYFDRQGINPGKAYGLTRAQTNRLVADLAKACLDADRAVVATVPAGDWRKQEELAVRAKHQAKERIGMQRKLSVEQLDALWSEWLSVRVFN